jgi:nuclear pore complex protein Nup93
MRGQSARDLRDKERLFIEQVQALNQARNQQQSFPIMAKFGEVESKASGDSPAQLVDSYAALKEITKESAGKASERMYAQQYADKISIPSELSQQILNGSRTYLEKTFYREVESIVDKNPREAQLGGRPSVVNKIRAYIRVRAARKNLAPDGIDLQQEGSDGDYQWALVFYLLRAGFVKEAAEYVENDPTFSSVDQRFRQYISAYANSPDRRLPRKTQERIDGDYSQRQKIKQSVDPYRMACYKVLGRCDLQSRNLDTVGQGVEDWLWLQFALARQQQKDQELIGDVFGLDQIEETITEIGEKHFLKTDGSSSYGTFFFMQILAGMFEKAVEYLHAINPVSAVHFAIALAYYGLLRVSDYQVAGNELRKYLPSLPSCVLLTILVTKATTEQNLINFVPLVAHYTATFRTALPIAAVDYLCLLCLNSDLKPPTMGQLHTNACHECLRELCLETREFAMLLGDLLSDGSRLPGAIEQRARLIRITTRDEFLRSITTQSAAVADQRGQIADAVLLYHLCDDYENVVKVLNRSLADAITLDLGESPASLQPLKPRQAESDSSSTAQSGPASSLSLTQSSSSPADLARDMISLYNTNASYYNKIHQTERQTCTTLLSLLTIRADLEASPPRYMTALESLNELNVIPLSAVGSIPVIRSAASAFGALSPLLARCVGISIVWAVRAIGGERDKIVREGTWETGYSGDRDGLKDQLASMAKDLMVFAGMVKYKLPARVFELLSKVGGDVGSY